MYEEIKDRIEQAKAASNEVLDAIRAAGRDITLVGLNAKLRAYVLYRFFLHDVSCEENNLMQLARLSLGRLLVETNDNLRALDLSGSCGGASSAETKKVLLLLSLQNALGIKFDPTRTADIETIEDLSAEILRLLPK